MDLFCNHKLKLDNDLLYYLAHIRLSMTGYNLKDTCIAGPHAEKDGSGSSLKKEVVLESNLPKEAKRDGNIVHTPSLPTMQRTESLRLWFSRAE